MARRKDVAGAVHGQRINAVTHLGPNFLRRPEWQDFLVLHRAMKTDPAAELRFQLHHVHPRAGPLNRIQDVDPHFHKQRQKRTATAVIMVEHLDAKLMTQVDEAFVVRGVELAIQFHADERSRLTA